MPSLAKLFFLGKRANKLKILVACEFSATVRDAFRKRGHDAFSCDFEPCEGDSSFHFQGDVLPHLNFGWDLLIGHPPCTFLTNTANSHLIKNGQIQKERFRQLCAAARFFLTLWNAPVKKICLENPIMTGLAKDIIGEEPAQIIQPWQFGHLETKATCLWLKGLKPLMPTSNLKQKTMQLPANIRQRLHYLPQTPDRWKLRSKTFPGIADAMAEQWGQ